MRKISCRPRNLARLQWKQPSRRKPNQGRSLRQPSISPLPSKPPPLLVSLPPPQASRTRLKSLQSRPLRRRRKTRYLLQARERKQSTARRLLRLVLLARPIRLSLQASDRIRTVITALRRMKEHLIRESVSGAWTELARTLFEVSLIRTNFPHVSDLSCELV